jgi:hypothetical protein
MDLKKEITAILIGLLLLSIGCGKDSKSTSEPRVPNKPPTGCLLVCEEIWPRLTISSPSGLVKRGVLDYKINWDGYIHYRGEIVYLGNEFAAGLNLPEFKQNISGRYRAKAATVHSSTYRHKGEQHDDFRVFATVQETNARSVSKLSVGVVDDSATGEIEIYTQDELIKIKSAKISGEVFGVDVVLNFEEE